MDERYCWTQAETAALRGNHGQARRWTELAKQAALLQEREDDLATTMRNLTVPQARALASTAL